MESPVFSILSTCIAMIKATKRDFFDSSYFFVKRRIFVFWLLHTPCLSWHIACVISKVLLRNLPQCQFDIFLFLTISTLRLHIPFYHLFISYSKLTQPSINVFLYVFFFVTPLLSGRLESSIWIDLDDTTQPPKIDERQQWEIPF